MKHLLIDAKHEIDTLRRRNELLQAKVDVVEVFSAALLGVPRNMGATIDISWQLQKEIDKLEHPERSEPTPT